VIIDNLNAMGVSVTPNKTDAPLVVDADTVLSFTIPVKSLQTIARRRGQIPQFRCAVKLPQLPPGYLLNRAKLLPAFAVIKSLRLLTAKRFDHKSRL
jgi:hypothetical protein